MTDVVEAMEAVTVHVTDIQRARKFYAEVLGLKEISFHEKASRAAFAIPGTGVQLTMHIQREGEGGRPPGTVSGLVFTHHDPAAALAEIRQRGGEVVEEAHTFTNPFAQVTLGVFADPDGNEFVIRRLDPLPK